MRLKLLLLISVILLCVTSCSRKVTHSENILIATSEMEQLANFVWAMSIRTNIFACLILTPPAKLTNANELHLLLMSDKFMSNRISSNRRWRESMQFLDPWNRPYVFEFGSATNDSDGEPGLSLRIMSFGPFPDSPKEALHSRSTIVYRELR